MLGLLVSLACACPGAHGASAVPARISITIADQAPQLIRGTHSYLAGRGVMLRSGDLVGTGGGGIQLDAGGATLALGPASRVYTRHGGELILLEGWMKLRGHSRQPLAVLTSSLQLASTGATVVVHVRGTTTELFVESNRVIAHELGAGQRRSSRHITHDQFATRQGLQPLRLADRPPEAFLASVPPAFRDELVPVGPAAVALPLLKARAAHFRDIAPWLAAHPGLRRQVQARFEPARPRNPGLRLGEAYP